MIALKSFSSSGKEFWEIYPYFCIIYTVPAFSPHLTFHFPISSKPLPLVVKHKPICVGGNRTQDLWADLGQPLRVLCDVTAVPAVESWWWTLNTSRHLDKLSGEGGASLTYTPHTERDYGLLACWAANSEGRMAAPCTFHLRRAVGGGGSRTLQQQQQQPWSGLDCSLHNQTLTSLIVSCIWDGQGRGGDEGGSGGGGAEAVSGPGKAEVGGNSRAEVGGPISSRRRFYYLEVREKEGGELVQNLTAGKDEITK